jgi:hypothetical protein
MLPSCDLFSYYLQGRPGEKGQKGELGSPGFDVFSAVKVRALVSLPTLFVTYTLCIQKEITFEIIK